MMMRQRDIVVTVPKAQWRAWIEEGDLPGDPESDMTSHFWLSNLPTGLQTFGEGATRVYVVSHGRLRGYAPLAGWEEVCSLRDDRACLLRTGFGATAVTIPEPIKGFQGFRYRWWDRADEIPFPSWQTEGVR